MSAAGSHRNCQRFDPDWARDRLEQAAGSARRRCPRRRGVLVHVVPVAGGQLALRGGVQVPVRVVGAHPLAEVEVAGDRLVAGLEEVQVSGAARRAAPSGGRARGPGA